MDCGKLQRRRISLASLQEMSREHAIRLNERYDCVDVWSDEGPLQFGRVVDAGSGGLFVDLLCPGWRRHFVPFGRVFWMRGNGIVPDWKRVYGRTLWPVEVLWRCHPHEPWTWRGAQLVVTARDDDYPRTSAGLVRLCDAAGRARGPLQVVPCPRIRDAGWDAVRRSGSGSSVLAAAANGRPPGEEELRRYYGSGYRDGYADLLVGPESFVFGRLQLPAACTAVSEETQRCLMEAWLSRSQLCL
ncbi:uncharacterized protein LOC129599753 [Paramacrobiotus metropolitanus]|uniref:uncharacterized protein LOC129599753 n=1 Tax=Paramacrobiotus metropolitanus TaxID=2943436 RepID=UPI002445945D|nr:uncharacterized protein LOC129599753 [Paramacrobiotus metropolitanus]